MAGGAAAVPDGLLEVTIETTPERGIGAQVEPGEFVAVVVTFDAFGPTPTLDGSAEQTVSADIGGAGPVRTVQSHFLLRRVLVTNVQSQSVVLGGDDAEQSRTPPSGSVLVTLAVLPDQVEPLVFRR